MKKTVLVRFTAILFAMSGMLLLCGCSSDGYYQEQAVRSARSFLLEEKPSMPLMEQEYIKFNRPFMLVSKLDGSYTTGTAQICICWMTPGNKDVYMVYGVSGLRMIDWIPQRVICKNFKQPQQLYLTLAPKASNDILQRQYGILSVASVNHIRFTLPGVWKCNFELNSNPDNEYTTEELKVADKLPRYVLAWKITENGQVFYSVYGGTAKDDTLEDFKYYFSGLYNEKDFMAGVNNSEPLIAPFGGTLN